jgi:hypothetical protein
MSGLRVRALDHLFDLHLHAGEEACCHAAVMIVATARSRYARRASGGGSEVQRGSQR